MSAARGIHPVNTPKLLTAAALALAAATVLAGAPPRLGKVLHVETAPAKGKSGAAVPHWAPLPRAAWHFDLGVYTSRATGLAIRLPRFADEKAVSVREAVATRRPDGEPASLQVLFVPDAEGTSVQRNGPVSAVQVTPLGEGPHDAGAVLKSLEPRSPQERKKLEARGFEFRRVATPLGEALEQVAPNRFVDAAFPQLTHVDQQAGAVNTVGVSRSVVSAGALLEFSQVLPCRGLAPPACKTAARTAADRFMQGVASFTPVQTAARPQGKASAPKQGK